MFLIAKHNADLVNWRLFSKHEKNKIGSNTLQHFVVLPALRFISLNLQKETKTQLVIEKVSLKLRSKIL